MIVLDTNVISELFRMHPNQSVSDYIDSLPPDEVFTAAVCEAEIRFGLARMPSGRRRDDLMERVTRFLDLGFADRILPFDRHCAAVYGDIRHAREASGMPMTIGDAMIAATVLAYGAKALATRNIRDFVDCGVTVVDPWAGQ